MIQVDQHELRSKWMPCCPPLCSQLGHNNNRFVLPDCQPVTALVPRPCLPSLDVLCALAVFLLEGFFRVHLPLAYKAEERLAEATETIRYVGRGTWKRCSQWRKHLCYLDPAPSPTVSSIRIPLTLMTNASSLSLQLPPQ